MIPLEDLEEKRDKILERFQKLGDLRRGSLRKRYLPCRKGRCHCTEPQSKGHGPKYSLTYKVKGKTRTEYIAPREAKQVSKQVSEHKKFLQLCQEFVEVSDRICRLRLSERKKKP